MPSKQTNPIQGYKKSDIGVIAVFQLGGVLHRIDLEDVAIKAYELAPKIFCWNKHPERINLEKARLALKDELTAKNSRIAGSIRDGWMLRPSGVSYCINLKSFVALQNIMEPIRRELSIVKTTPAFIKTVKGDIGNISGIDINSLLRVNPYFSIREVHDRVLALSNIAVFDRDLQTVLNRLITKGFKELEALNE